MTPRSLTTAVLGAVAALSLVLVLPPAPAQAAGLLRAVVSPVPAATTPHAVDEAGVDSDVDTFAQVGGTMYAGGRFVRAQDPTGRVSYVRNNIMAFDASSGAMRPLAPVFDGRVWAIVPGPGGSLLVAGEFTTVNGVARRGVAKVDAVTGALDTRFRAAGMTSGAVTDAQLVRGRLVVSGSFPRRLLALDPATGADTGYVRLAITGQGEPNSGPTHVYRFAVDPAGTRLVAIGEFTSVGGQARQQAFMAVLGANSVAVSSWYDPGFDRQCAAPEFPAYLRDVDFSPDGARFGFVSAGYVPQTGDLGRTVCDATALYDASSRSPTSRPIWVNYTGGDTLHSIAITGAVVYVGGHQRWLDNPYGQNSAGRGAVPRSGIGAISTATGRAIAWNPGKERGVGAKALYATSAGLWVGSDTRLFNGRVRDSIAFCALP
jgi:hypothetical protein